MGITAGSLAAIFIFQNCGSKSEFSPISSSEGDITDPVIANSAKCEYDGKQYYHTQTIKIFKESSVAFNKSCEQQEHICNNGNWSGTIGYKECAVGAVRDCLVGTETVKHNTEVTRFQATSVAYNQSCQSEVRRCFDGSISGSFIAKSCVVHAPPSATNNYECKTRDAQNNNQLMDLYQKWTDGSSRKIEICSDWQQTQQNSGDNCGKLTNGIYGQYTTIAQQVSCCPQGKTTVNGLCMPYAQQGEACYGSNNCANGLECRGNEATTPTNPYGRRCQLR